MIDALNLTVSVQGVDDKLKATLHWWSIDTPLSLEEQISGEQGPEPESDTLPTATDDLAPPFPLGYGYSPLGAKARML